MSEQLKKAIGALTATVKENPQAAKAVFRATTVSSIEGFTTTSRVRGFHLLLDEPKDLGGNDTGPNPVEAVLAALGSCQAIVYRAYAAALGLRIDRVEVETKGHLDLHGFLGLGDVRAGFDRVEFATRIVSPEPEGRIRELARLVEEHCPVLDTLRSTVEVTGTVEVSPAVPGSDRNAA
jgi:uncharacterized OsmC-like protein